jgi:hypothetical protein
MGGSEHLTPGAESDEGEKPLLTEQECRSTHNQIEWGGDLELPGAVPGESEVGIA